MLTRSSDAPNFQSLFEAMPGLYLVLSPDLTIVAVNDFYCRATMTLRDQIVGRNIFDVFPDNPDDSGATGVANMRSSLARVLEFKRPDTMFYQKYDIRKPESDGGGFEERYWDPLNTPVLDHNGEIVSIIHRVEDVTDLVRLRTDWSAREKTALEQDIAIDDLNIVHQKVADALLISEDRFRTLADNLPGVVYRRLVSPDGHMRDIYVSPGVRAMLGVDPEEFISGRSILPDFIHPDDRERKLKALKEYGARLEPLVIEVRKISRPDGKIRWWQIHTRPTQLENGNIQWDGIALDITDRKAAERQLQQAVKMEAVGQLTGGMAHDFNNLLTVILANTATLSEEVTDPQLQPLAELACKAAERGAELTRSLLAFSRRQPLEPRSVDVTKLIAGMDDLLKRSLGEQIEIRCVVAADLWPALADPVRLESAVLNLAINARDAMPGGGKLTIETANAEIDATCSAAHDAVMPGQYVVVSVSDSGAGMSPEIMARAFEPFFSTKDVGKGTGLGLSTIFGFVKQSNGHISVYSELGIGTTIRLYLPRAPDESIIDTQTVHVPRAEPRGMETILLVEDDELVRTHVEGLLRHLGYRTVSAPNGVAALAMIERGDAFDVLFTDMVMPGGMSGRDLVEKAATLRPNLKVLYTSGYTENAALQNGHLDPGVQFLHKPYRRQELAQKLRALLD
jgi:PAS domain S-box-containing protein